jgi:putative endonuclease
MEKKDTGFLGETASAKLLEDKGYTILERNWRWKKQEIDIIALKNGVLVFAEVKTRATREYGDPGSFVSGKQKTGIIKAANFYITEVNPIHNDVRFDIFSVFDYNIGMDIDHIEEAFYPTVNEIRI